jgi:hypothetical protein
LFREYDILYVLDRIGNRLSATRSLGGLPLPAVAYTPNALHQVTEVASADALLTRHLVYDADCNLAGETCDAWPNTTWTYAHDEKNQLESILIVSGDDSNGDRVTIRIGRDAFGWMTSRSVEEVRTEEGNEYVLAQDEILFHHDGDKVVEERAPDGRRLRQYVWGRGEHTEPTGRARHGCGRATDSRLRPPRRGRRKGGHRGRLRVLPLSRPRHQHRHLAVPLPAAGDAVVVPADVLQHLERPVRVVRADRPAL